MRLIQEQNILIVTTPIVYKEMYHQMLNNISATPFVVLNTAQNRQDNHIGKLAHLLFETNDYTTYGYGTKLFKLKIAKNKLNVQLFIFIYIVYVCIVSQYSSESLD